MKREPRLWKSGTAAKVVTLAFLGGWSLSGCGHEATSYNASVACQNRPPTCDSSRDGESLACDNAEHALCQRCELVTSPDGVDQWMWILFQYPNTCAVPNHPHPGRECSTPGVTQSIRTWQFTYQCTCEAGTATNTWRCCSGAYRDTCSSPDLSAPAQPVDLGEPHD